MSALLYILLTHSLSSHPCSLSLLLASSCLFSLRRFHSISLHAAAPLPYAISLMQSELNRVSIVPTLNDCLLPASNSVSPPPLLLRMLPPVRSQVSCAHCMQLGCGKLCCIWVVAAEHQSLSFAIKCSLVQRLASCHTASLPPLLPLATPRCRCSSSSSSRTIIIPARLHFF